MILTPLQKFTKNEEDLGKFIVAKCFELLPKVQKIVQSGHTARYGTVKLILQRKPYKVEEVEDKREEKEMMMKWL